MIRFIRPRAAPSPRPGDEPIRRFVAVLERLEASPRPQRAAEAATRPAAARPQGDSAARRR